MNWLLNLLGQLTSGLQPYLSEIALTLLATVLVVYGDLVNKQIKRLIKPYHFILRTAVFVLVCAFGYGLFIVFAMPFVKQGILAIPYDYRGIAVVSMFLILGYLAEHRRYI